MTDNSHPKSLTVLKSDACQKLRFVAVQKLREKKLISEEGTLEIVTKITREQTSKNVSFNTHARELDGESLASQV